MNKVLVILGMHRSGTSLISRWLMECGLNIGDKLYGPGTGNEEGHFEDLDFLHLHQEILTNHHLPETGLTDIPLEVLSTGEYQRLCDIINHKSKLHEQWGWKDPRTCMFLDIYRKAIPSAKYFVIIRHYNDVVNSLVKRDFKKLEKTVMTKRSRLYQLLFRLRRRQLLSGFYDLYAEKYLAVWLSYNIAIYEHLQKISEDDFILVDCPMLLQDAPAVLNHLTQSWNFALHFFDFRKVYNEAMLSVSHDIARFVKHSQLITRADALLAKLAAYDFIKKHTVYADNGYQGGKTVLST